MRRVKCRGQPGDAHITLEYMTHVHIAHKTFAALLQEHAAATKRIGVWHVYNDEHKDGNGAPQWCKYIDDCVKHVTTHQHADKRPEGTATQAPAKRKSTASQAQKGRKATQSTSPDASKPESEAPPAAESHARHKTIRFRVAKTKHPHHTETPMSITVSASSSDTAETVMAKVARAAREHHNTTIPADPAEHICSHYNGTQAHTTVHLNGSLQDANTGQIYDLRRVGAQSPQQVQPQSPPEPEGETLDEQSPIPRQYTGTKVKLVSIHLQDGDNVTQSEMELKTNLAIQSDDTEAKFHQRLTATVERLKARTLKELGSYEAIDSIRNEPATLDGTLRGAESGTLYYIREKQAHCPLSPTAQAQRDWEESQKNPRGVPDEHAQRLSENNSEAKMATDVRDLGDKALEMPAKELLNRLRGSELSRELLDDTLLESTGAAPLHPSILRPCVPVGRSQLLLPEYFAHSKTALDLLLEPDTQDYAIQANGSIRPKEDQLPPIRTMLQLMRASEALDIYASATKRQTQEQSFQHRTYIRKLDNMSTQYELEAIKRYDRTFRALRHHEEIKSWDQERMDLTIKFLLPGLKKARQDTQHKASNNRRNGQQRLQTGNMNRGAPRQRIAKPNTQVCRDFQNNSCKRGNNCRFKHTRATNNQNAHKPQIKRN